MADCYNCGKVLTNNEIGLYKKLINRGSEEFMCKKCLAKRIGCPEELLTQKIKQFYLDGCGLFTGDDE